MKKVWLNCFLGSYKVLQNAWWTQSYNIIEKNRKSRKIRIKTQKKLENNSGFQIFGNGNPVF